jgi:hypothetical protein
MSEQTTFVFHNDPGHAWLQVDWTQLKDVGLSPTDFSCYSYRRRNTFYLEEDCDAPKFVAAWKAKHGPDSFKFNETYTEHTFIRDLPSIHE